MNTKPFALISVPVAMLLSCGSSADEQASDCTLQISLSGGGTQHVTDGSSVSCGGGYSPGNVEIGFTVANGALVKRFIFQVPDLRADSVDTTIPAHLRMLPSASDYDAPGWLADDCTATIDRIRIQQDGDPATLAYVTAHGACAAPAEPEPGNPSPTLAVGSFRFTSIAGWNN